MWCIQCEVLSEIDVVSLFISTFKYCQLHLSELEKSEDHNLLGFQFSF